MTTIILNTLGLGRLPSAIAFLVGASEAFNLSGTSRRRYHFAATAADADASAVQNDWEAIGDDLADAFQLAG